jgi:hypothetical protein
MPGVKRGLSVCDVAIHTNHNIFPLPNKILEANPLPPDPFELSNDLWMGKIDAEAAKLTLNLGESDCYGTPKPVIQYAQLYSFVRERDKLATPYQWDEDSRLQTCVAVSRLVQPTTISLRYAARIRYNSDSSIADISPANIRGVAIDTFLANPPERDWFIEADAMRLRGLIQRLGSSPLPERASRALWYHEYAVRTYYIEIRWVLIATGLEALVHAGHERSTRQFKCRISQLATELGVTGLGISEAKRAYEHRSSLAHGRQLGQVSDPDRELYQSMETTLRRAILRAIEDDAFASVLKDSEKIKTRWPI